MHLNPFGIIFTETINRGKLTIIFTAQQTAAPVLHKICVFCWLHFQLECNLFYLKSAKKTDLQARMLCNKDVRRVFRKCVSAIPLFHKSNCNHDLMNFNTSTAYTLKRPGSVWKSNLDISSSCTWYSHSWCLKSFWNSYRHKFAPSFFCIECPSPLADASEQFSWKNTFLSWLIYDSFLLELTHSKHANRRAPNLMSLWQQNILTNVNMFYSKGALMFS